MTARHTLGLIIVAALFVSRAAGADPPKSKVITLSDSEGGVGRRTMYLPTARRILETERRGLTTCHELALAEDPTFAAEIPASILISPNGEVSSVTIPEGAIPEPVRACVRWRLSRLMFDPPGGQGSLLHVTIIFGEPDNTTHARLPFQIEPVVGAFMLGTIVLRFDTPRPAPAFRAVRAAVEVVKTCAKQASPEVATLLDARLLVSDTGALVRFDTSISNPTPNTSSPASDAIVRCVAKKNWPVASGRLSRVDLRFSITPKGEVTVAP